MSNKIKPWHQRKPKRHDEFRGKKPHTRPGQGKANRPRGNDQQDHYDDRWSFNVSEEHLED